MAKQTVNEEYVDAVDNWLFNAGEEGSEKFVIDGKEFEFEREWISNELELFKVLDENGTVLAAYTHPDDLYADDSKLFSVNN